MVLLKVAAAFAVLSVALFVIGVVTDRPELAMLGAIVMVGVGGTGAVQGFQVESGSEERTFSETDYVADEDFSNTTFVQELDSSGEDAAPTGLDLEASGNWLYLAGDGTDSVYQYDAAGYDPSLAQLEHARDVSANTTSPSDVEVRGDGGRMWVLDAQNDRVVQYRMEREHNASNATYQSELQLGGPVATPVAMAFGDGGSLLFVLDSQAELHEFTLQADYGVAGATRGASVNFSSRDTDPAGVEFSGDGRRMLLLGQNASAVYAYSLGEPFDVQSAEYTGDSLDVTPEADVLTGLVYEDEGRELFVSDSQATGSNAPGANHYDSSEALSSERKVSEKRYRDVSTHSSFPLDLVILLIGVVMLMGGAGEASEN